MSQIRERTDTLPPDIRSGLNRVKGTSFRELAYAEIRRALLSGHFAPGESLTIRHLAEKLGLGVMPVRESVQQLVTQGALEFLPNRFVRVPLLGRREIEEVFELRILNEGFAVEKAARQISAEQLTVLGNLLSRLVAASEGDDAHVALNANLEFHFFMYRAATSDSLVNIIEQLWLRVGPLHIVPFMGPLAERSEYTAVALHARLVKALKAHNHEQARAALTAMLLRSLKWHLAHLPNSPALVAAEAR